MNSNVLPVSLRIAGLTFLVGAYALQSYLIYSDETAFYAEPLSPSAQQGQKIWLEENCQSCHQIYGFGGFLGPDLTNRGKLFSTSALKAILSIGPKQMPAFDFSDQQIEHLHAFFNELDKTGQSQPRSTTSDPLTSLPWFTYAK